jgi:hypothetical protein
MNCARVRGFHAAEDDQACRFHVRVFSSCTTWLARAQVEKAAHPAMAPRARYLTPDKDAEVVLARSAAPASISDEAEVMVLGRESYTTAVKGRPSF